jgi:hypothetical protein
LFPRFHGSTTGFSPNFVVDHTPVGGFGGTLANNVHFHSARLSYKMRPAVSKCMLATKTTSEPRTRRRIDVTDLSTETVDAYVRAHTPDTADCSFERRGARTYLVVDV